MLLHVDGVGDGADEAQLGKPAALVLGDGDEAQVVAQAGEALLGGRVGRAVQRGHHGRAEEAVHERAHGARGEAVVVVDEVELARPPVGLHAVHDLEVALRAMCSLGARSKT